jgi:hypothetical protein
MTVVSQRTYVDLPGAPPVQYYPDEMGDAIPPGGARWQLLVDSAGYPEGSSADLALEYQYDGMWLQDTIVGGFELGSVNWLRSSIGAMAMPYPSHARVRVDRLDAGTLASVTLEIL